MQLNGLDGARYLGIEPTRALTATARILMLKLNNLVVDEASRLDG